MYWLYDLSECIPQVPQHNEVHITSFTLSLREAIFGGSFAVNFLLGIRHRMVKIFFLYCVRTLYLHVSALFVSKFSSLFSFVTLCFSSFSLHFHPCQTSRLICIWFQVSLFQSLCTAVSEFWSSLCRTSGHICVKFQVTFVSNFMSHLSDLRSYLCQISCLICQTAVLICVEIYVSSIRHQVSSVSNFMSYLSDIRSHLCQTSGLICVKLHVLSIRFKVSALSDIMSQLCHTLSLNLCYTLDLICQT